VSVEETAAMVKHFKVIVEKHPDGYVAYPLGLKGVIAGEGDTYEEGLADVKSAIIFHIEAFGFEVVEDAASGLAWSPSRAVPAAAAGGGTAARCGAVAQSGVGGRSAPAAGRESYGH
jgi:predicted RNase H-like HicB family nuclease